MSQPTQAPQDRYLPNDMPRQTLTNTPKELFQAALEVLVNKYPPREKVSEEDLWGLYGGYTGLSLLFLQLSALHPNVKVETQSLRQWAGRYLKTERGTYTKLPKPACGLIDENLSCKAMNACITGSEEDVDLFLADLVAAGSPIPQGQEDTYDTELLQGRAGALYLLRLVRHWVPECQGKINEHISNIAERLLQSNDYGQKSWYWVNGCYLGAVHGDIGNITQLVLSMPSVAPKLEGLLERVLSLQFGDGGWPRFSDRNETETISVQFCHGVTGFIYSLWALRPHFPKLETAIDDAIIKGHACIWEKGILKKEPGLCHGLLGNGLALSRGPQRDHFLALATPDAIAKARIDNPDVFPDAHYEWKYAVSMVYDLSAVWAWGVCEMEQPPMISYTDV